MTTPSALGINEAKGHERAAPMRWWQRFNIDLALLVLALFAINLPYFSPQFMPGHDTRSVFLVFHEFYSHVYWTHSIPRWQPADYGYSNTIWHVLNLSAGDYFVGLIGLATRATDTLLLFKLACVADQLIFLLGVYLLARILYAQRATVFLVTLAAVCSTVWTYQIWWNFRLFYGLPLIIYLLFRFVLERRVMFLWLAGCAMVITTLGGGPYWIPIWTLFLAVISLTLMIQMRRFPIRRGRPSGENLLAFALLGVIGVAFLMWATRGVGDLHNFSPGRNHSGMRTSRWTFLTYIPPLGEWLDGFWDITTVKVDVTAYVGLLFIPMFFIALIKVRTPAFISIVTGALMMFLLASCGIFTWLAYDIPGMSLARHLGYFVTVAKIAGLLSAGFGLDFVLHAVDSSTKIQRWYSLTNVALAVAVTWIISDTSIGAGLFDLQKSGDSLEVIALKGVWVMLPRMTAYALVFVLPYTIIKMRRRVDLHTRIVIERLIVAAVVIDCLLFQCKVYALTWRSTYHGTLTVDKPEYFAERSNTVSAGVFNRFSDVFASPGEKYSVNASVIGYQPSLPRAPVVRAKNEDPNVAPLRMDVCSENVYRSIYARGGRPSQKPSSEFIPDDDAPLMHVLGVNFPKLRLVSEAVCAQNREEVDRLLGATKDIDKAVILRGAAAKDLATTLSGESIPENSSGGSITVLSYDFNHIRLKVDPGLAAPVWLVYADAYDPHWTAVVNGNRVQIAEAYGAFKAVLLKDATNIVTFTYSDLPAEIASDALMTGAMIFYCAMILALVCQMKRTEFIATTPII